MPKDTTIGVSNETKELLEEFKKDSGAKSLDEAVKLAVGWGRSYNHLLVSQTELDERISKLENSQNGIYVYLSHVLQNVLANNKRIQKMEDYKK